MSIGIKCMVYLAANRERTNDKTTQRKIERMQINLTNFKMAYSTALGDIPKNDEMLETLWPATYSIEKLIPFKKH